MQKNSRYTIFIIAAILLTSVALFFWKYHWPEATVSLSGETMNVLVAETMYHQHKGLGDRDSLGEYDGMLFKFFPDRRVGIVMRDMRFAIDIIWLHDGKVIDFVSDVKPEPNKKEEDLTTYYPRKEADMVLEVPAGWTKEHDLEIGDKLKLISQ